MNTSKNILLFGATGFVGEKIVEQLTSDGFHPILVVRKKTYQTHGATEIIGTLDDPLALEKNISKYNPSTMIYLIGIIKENKNKNITFQKMHVDWLVQACKLAQSLGIKRILYMSANGAKINGTGYQSSKFMAEEYLKKSHFSWTILRPSIIID